nr:hypothetical protein [Tanacetum cinerariifolium]
TILNTSDHLGNFEGKANDGFLVGYAAHSKAYRVYNLSSKKVEETLNLRYLEDKPNVEGLVQEWYFDLDYLTDSLGYTRFKTNPPVATHDTNIITGTQDDDSESECDEQVILVPSFPSNSFSGPKVHKVSAPIENNLDYAKELARLQRQEHEAHSAATKYGFEFSNETAEMLHQAEIKTRRNLVLAAGDPAGSIVSTGGVLAGSVPAGSIPASSVPVHSVPTSNVPAGGVPAGRIDSVGFGDPTASESVPTVFTPDHAAVFPLPSGHSLGSSEHSTRFPSPSDLGNHQPTVGIFSSSSYDDDFCADVTNLASSVAVDPVATKRVNTIHPQSQIIGALQSPIQTRSTHVWKLVPLPAGKIAIGTKWILKNKRDARGIVVRNKARLVAQGHRQEEGIDYDEVFAPVARIEAIKLFLAFVSYMGFMVYQMDVKSTFLYKEIEEEEVLSTFLLKHHYKRGTIDKTLFLKKDSRHIILVQVYVDDIIFGSTNKAWCDEFEVLMKGEFKMSAMGELTFFLGLQVKQLPDGIFISQDKYVKDMLKKFDMECVRTATTPYEVPKHKSKDEPNDAVNVHLYRSMIGSLMYLTASRPDIMFAVNACSRHQLKAYSDSDYDGSYGDRKSTTGGCQFLVAVVRCTIPTSSCTIPIGSGTIPTGSGTIPTGCCILPIGGYLFMLLDWSHIRYALTHHPPIVFDSLVKQFWATTTVRTLEAGPSKIIATIDGNEVVVSESLIRTHLQLNDANGLYEFTLHDVLDGMREIGFLQMILGIQTIDPSPRPTFDFTAKLFSNMKLNWDGPHMPLLAPVLVVPAGGDGADAVVAGAAAAHDVPPPLPPPIVPSTHSSSSTPVPSTAAQAILVREPTLVRDPHQPPSLPPYPRSEEGGPTRQNSFQEDISEGGGDFVSSPKSNEAPQTPAVIAAGGAEDSAALINLSLKLDRCIIRVTTLENELGVTKKVLGGAVLKMVTRVKRLEGLLQQRKQRLVLSDSEGKEASTKEQDIDLDALHQLASKSLGGDSIVEAAYTIYKASQDAHASSDAGHNEAKVPDDTTMPFRRTSTTRRCLRKPFTSSAFVHFPEHISTVEDTLPAGEGIPAAAPTIPAGSTTIPAGTGLSAQRHRELDAAQIIYTEAYWLELMAKIATNSALSKQLLGDDVNEENMNERLGMLLIRKRRELAKQSQVKPMNKTHQRDYMRDFMKNQSASIYNQGWTMKQVPVSVHTIPSVVAAISVFAAPYVPADIEEIVPSLLGSIHAYYDMEGHTKHFTSLCELLYMVEKNDLQKLLGVVDNLYQREEPDTFALLLWGDLHVHVLETMDGRVIYLFVDVCYPLSAATLQRMLKHGLEVPKLLVGGDLTMAEQLVSFIKAALLNAQSAV